MYKLLWISLLFNLKVLSFVHLRVFDFRCDHSKVTSKTPVTENYAPCRPKRSSGVVLPWSKRVVGDVRTFSPLFQDDLGTTDITRVTILFGSSRNSHLCSYRTDTNRDLLQNSLNIEYVGVVHWTSLQKSFFQSKKV